mmetsp:Transcript_92844/g.149898  ORF Transcript_92844/g.149898 Transcript_92844/m.149898 type:complete len:88 (-) Transcript_92844:1619-1882(-)
MCVRQVFDSIYNKWLTQPVKSLTQEVVHTSRLRHQKQCRFDTTNKVLLTQTGIDNKPNLSTLFWRQNLEIYSDAQARQDGQDCQSCG